jgi:hypothetical protein
MENYCKFYDHLEYFTVIWHILFPFGNVVVIWYIYPRFGKLCQEKSGNPGSGAGETTKLEKPPKRTMDVELFLGPLQLDLFFSSFNKSQASPEARSRSREHVLIRALTIFSNCDLFWATLG